MLTFGDTIIHDSLEHLLKVPPNLIYLCESICMCIWCLSFSYCFVLCTRVSLMALSNIYQKCHLKLNIYLNLFGWIGWLLFEFDTLQHLSKVPLETNYLFKYIYMDRMLIVWIYIMDRMLKCLNLYAWIGCLLFSCCSVLFTIYQFSIY